MSPNGKTTKNEKVWKTIVFFNVFLTFRLTNFQENPTFSLLNLVPKIVSIQITYFSDFRLNFTWILAPFSWSWSNFWPPDGRLGEPVSQYSHSNASFGVKSDEFGASRPLRRVFLTSNRSIYWQNILKILNLLTNCKKKPWLW